MAGGGPGDAPGEGTRRSEDPQNDYQTSNKDREHVAPEATRSDVWSVGLSPPPATTKSKGTPRQMTGPGKIQIKYTQKRTPKRDDPLNILEWKGLGLPHQPPRPSPPPYHDRPPSRTVSKRTDTQGRP